MQVDKMFVSVNARDFAALSQWWATLLGRKWEREPMPSCREWTLAENMLFQVLDNPDKAGDGTVTMHTQNLDDELKRLRSAGIAVPDPVKVEAFTTLRYAEFEDPEGNKVGLLDGE